MQSSRRTFILLLPVVAVLFASAQLFAHAVVFPRRAEPGAYERYVLRVPNERDLNTTRVEIRFPAGLRVVSFSEVQGWKLEIITDSAKSVVGAVWTGTLPAMRFIEFPFIAVNPKTSAELVWPAYQTYADGEKVEWTGPEGSDKPASVTRIGAVAAAAPAEDSATAAPAELAPKAGKAGMSLSVVAIVLSLLALGIAARKNGGDR